MLRDAPLESPSVCWLAPWTEASAPSLPSLRRDLASCATEPERAACVDRAARLAASLLGRGALMSRAEHPLEQRLVIDRCGLVSPTLLAHPTLGPAWRATFREASGLRALLRPWLYVLAQGVAHQHERRELERLLLDDLPTGEEPRCEEATRLLLCACSPAAASRGALYAQRLRELARADQLLLMFWQVAGAWWSFEIQALAAAPHFAGGGPLSAGALPHRTALVSRALEMLI